MVRLNLVKRRQRFGYLPWDNCPTVALRGSDVFKIKDDDDGCGE